MEEVVWITEKELFTVVFKFGSKPHKNHGKQMRLQEPIKLEGQDEGAYKDRLRDSHNLFELYKDCVDRYKNTACEFYHFHCYRGELFEFEGNFEKAMSDYTIALENESMLSEVYFCKARILFRLGQVIEAFENFQMGLNIDIKYGDREAIGYSQIGKSFIISLQDISDKNDPTIYDTEKIGRLIMQVWNRKDENAQLLVQYKKVIDQCKSALSM